MVILVTPSVWLITRSIMPYKDIFAVPTVWIPQQITLEHFRSMLTRATWPFGTYLLNTMLVTVGVLIGRVLTASIVAYGFARIRFPGRDALFVICLGTMMVPPQVTMIPTYILFQKLGWLNTLLPLIVPAFGGGGAFYIFMLRQFVMTIPGELDDAARIDGCSRMGIYWRIIFPLLGPAIVTIVVFSFLETWNDFLGPLLYLTRPGTQTLALALQQFVQVFFMEAEMIFAVGTVAMLPPLVIFFLGQRFFTQGIVTSGLKG
jgi:multiple sugar transport system permease protein